MELEIVRLETAEKSLFEIFQYHKLNVSLNTARKIITSIVKSADILTEHPSAGQVEEFLKKRKLKYRSIVSDNYKPIYTNGKKFVYIHLVIDTRQSPSKMENSL
ncbi:MAG: hypothetical protein LH629_02440 [Ignavibacteria bacterium]|nr:hypothetical protein [Ignavibacteria bacterium]